MKHKSKEETTNEVETISMTNNKDVLIGTGIFCELVSLFCYTFIVVKLIVTGQISTEAFTTLILFGISFDLLSIPGFKALLKN